MTSEIYRITNRVFDLIHLHLHNLINNVLIGLEILIRLQPSIERLPNIQVLQ
jgi:hypothetical protein